MGAWEDELWDEARWEAYLRAERSRMHRLLEDYFAFVRQHPYPEPRTSEAIQHWRMRLQAFLRAQGWDEEAIGHVSQLRDELFPEAPYGEEEDEPFALPEIAAYYALHAQATRLGERILSWADALPGHMKDSTLVHFCAQVLQVPWHLAQGHLLGYERETLGGNIVCTRDALAAANAALDVLAEMRQAPYMKVTHYFAFYEALYELRNALALHVVRLRARFELGIE